MLQSIYSTRLLYVVAMFFVKQSLLVFYLRLDRRRVMRWTVYGLMFVVAALNIGSGVVLAISCFPPALFWDVDGVVDGECMAPAAQQAFYDANGYLKYVSLLLPPLEDRNLLMAMTQYHHRHRHICCADAHVMEHPDSPAPKDCLVGCLWSWVLFCRW